MAYGGLATAPSTPAISGGYKGLTAPVAPAPAPTAPEPLSGLGYVAAPVASAVQGAEQGYQGIPNAPKNGQFVGTGFNDALHATIDAASGALKQGINNLTSEGTTLLDTHSSLLQKGVAAGEAGIQVVNTLFGTLLSPLQGLATVPGVGNVVDVVNKIMGAVSNGSGEGAVQVLKESPLPQSAKDTLTPLVYDGAALAGQFIAGKLGGDSIGLLRDKVTAIADNLHSQLQVAKTTVEGQLPKDITPTGTSAETPIPFANKYETPSTIQMGVKPKDTLPVAASSPVEAPTSQNPAPTAPITPKDGYLYHGTDKATADAIRAAGGFTEDTAKIAQDLIGGKVDPNAPVSLTLDKATGELYSGTRPSGKQGSLLTFDASGLKIATESQAKGQTVDALKAKGYDGFSKSSPHDEMVETIVFNKDKLKLVTPKVEGGTMKVKISDIHTLAGNKIDIAKSKLIEAPSLTPNAPVKVSIDENGTITIHDGAHRVSEALKRGDTEISAQVIGSPKASEVSPESRVVPLNETPKEVTPQKTGQVTKAAKDINATLVKQGYDALPPELQSKYTPESYKAELVKSKDLASTNYEDAVARATGKKPLGNHEGQILFNEVERIATENGDYQTLLDLASSPLGKKLSQAGQTLGAAGFNDNPNSVVDAIRKVQEARQTAVEKVTPEATTRIVESIRKTNTVQSWSDFVRSIQC